MEQTFRDLWNAQRQTKREVFSLVVWMFIETGIGIFREHLLLISPGAVMQTMIKSIGSSALTSLLFILPFMIMEVVNRRNLNEDFPTFLFLIMWLNLFAVTLVLLPILRSWRTGNHDMSNPVPAQGNGRFTNPRSAALISIGLILAPGILPLLESVGWLSLDRLFNGPNAEVEYLPGMFMSLGLILFPIAGGTVAGRPIVRTLRGGGSLFAHPIHLIIVLVLSFLFAWSVVSLIVDQWPCFIGVPVCD